MCFFGRDSVVVDQDADNLGASVVISREHLFLQDSVTLF